MCAAYEAITSIHIAHALTNRTGSPLEKRLSLCFSGKTKKGGGADMGLMSTEEAIRAYEEILYDPNSSPEQKAVARIALESLRGY